MRIQAMKILLSDAKSLLLLSHKILKEKEQDDTITFVLKNIRDSIAYIDAVIRTLEYIDGYSDLNPDEQV